MSTQLQLRASQQASASTEDRISSPDKGKGRTQESSGENLLPDRRAPSPPQPQPPSPTWDIELDLNGSPSPESRPPPVRKRPPSPVWDIELDLNASDAEDSDDTRREDEKGRKRPREDSAEFGAPAMLTGS